MLPAPPDRARRSARVRRGWRAASRRRARAFVIFAILIVLFVGSLYVILNGLNTATASMKLTRDDANAAVLKAAKEGLIAWAATRANDGPGHLPCPDRKQVNNALAGYQEGTCVGASARIGRLPFRTLGMPDLRDASGERLWYALSPGFRDGATVPVNSDTQGALTVEGMNAASSVVAIIFAPGTVVGTQVRDPASSTNPANYLEGMNPYLADVFLAWSGCEASGCALPFSGGAPVTRPHNDQFILVTHEDLFRVVEAVVQRRIELEIAPRLTNPVPGGTAAVAACEAAEAITPGSYVLPAGYAPGYFEQWARDEFGTCKWLRGFFPFAAPYDDPAGSPTDPSRPQNQYVGRAFQIAGLPPVSDTPTWAATVTTPNPPGSTITAPTCSATTCTFTYSCDLSCGSLPVTATVRLRNAAGSFVLPTGITSSSDWTGRVAVPIWPFNPPIAGFSRSFDLATGDLVFSFGFTLPQTPVPESVDITPPTTLFSAFTNAANWFIQNGWYRQTYYAVSDGFRLRADLGTRQIDPAGPGYAPCQPESDPPTNPAEACVRVRNGPATARAVLVLAGRHLPGGPRGYTIGQYFELQNADVPGSTGAPPNLLFERGLRSTDFNDRVVVVASEPTP